jgi:hypothetical protein
LSIIRLLHDAASGLRPLPSEQGLDRVQRLFQSQIGEDFRRGFRFVLRVQVRT